MLKKTKGIILHKIKYGESGLIIHVYTEKFGRQTYILKGLFSKKNKRKNLIFPLSMLDFEVYYKNTREIQIVKEFRTFAVYHSIPFDIHKSTLSLFLAEILHKVLIEEVFNKPLYAFLIQSFIFLDETPINISSFHLLFLIQLSRFLGFYPQNNFSDLNSFFHLKAGYFTSVKDVDYGLNSKISKVFSNLLSLPLLECSTLQTDIHKTELLEALLLFYEIQTEGLGKVKSLEVLKNVYK